MFCLLPPTRLALGRLPPERVADASGLFNLMRNLGGAIGLALVLGRQGMPYRSRERRQVAALARVVDTRLRELHRARSQARHARAGTSRIAPPTW